MKFNLVLNVREGRKLKDKILVEVSSEVYPHRGDGITYSIGNNKAFVGVVSDIFHNFGFEQVAVPINVFAEVAEQDFLPGDKP